MAWGIGNVAVAKAPLGGLALAFHRLWLGALLYTIALGLRGGLRFTRRDVRLALPGAVAFALDIAFFFEATKHTTLADATTISALQPLVILALAGRRFGERVRALHVVCALTAIAGVALVVRGSGATGKVTLYGEVMAILATGAWAWYFVASKEARRHLGTLEYLTLVFLLGIPLMGVVALLSGQLTGPEGRIGVESLAWVAAVVLLPGSGHLLVNWAHHHTTITLTSLVTLLMPVLSTAGAAVFLDQPVGPLQVVGIVVVTAALVPVIMLERS